MTDFEKLFDSLSLELSAKQKKLSVETALGVYYGISSDGHMRISFLSSCHAPKMESTKLLQVTQGFESANVCWTCFDLLDSNAQKVFFAFCANLINAIRGITNEECALLMLKRRYITWKAMFGKQSKAVPVSREVLQGLYGELYFLKKYMLPQYGACAAVKAWSGPDGRSKDYSIGTEWYEVKTVGANADKVRISSLAQLQSQYPGHLVIVRSEAMSDEFDNGESSILDLFTYVISEINDEIIEGMFINKLRHYGFSPEDKTFSAKYNVTSFNLYNVDSSFPKIAIDDVHRDEICDVSYALNINSLKKYMEA